MRRSIVLVTLLVLLAAAAATAACSGAGDAASPAPPSTPEPDSSAATSPPADPAAGTRLAPGLYDLEDGTVVAVGTVEYRDLEGGFWAVVGGTEAEGNAGEVVAVLTNGEEFAGQFRANQGLSFEVHGERAGEVSVRMAGPEITAKSVVLAAEGGPAE